MAELLGEAALFMVPLVGIQIAAGISDTINADKLGKMQAQEANKKVEDVWLIWYIIKEWNILFL